MWLVLVRCWCGWCGVGQGVLGGASVVVVVWCGVGVLGGSVVPDVLSLNA